MLKFEPILKSLIWGGEKIAPYKGISTDCHAIGECWELSGLAGDESVVAEGPDRGMRLSKLIDRDGASLVGARNYARFGNEFPLLIKFIDADKDLSIQVHPDDRMARKYHHCHGKSEMWYVVDNDEGAHLSLGFNRPVTPETYEEAVQKGTIRDLLAEYRIQEGDLFHIPAGRIHTIGAGSMLVEIQQASNITYRIYDYGRLGCDGKPRELHTELAKEALDFTVQPDYRIAYEQRTDEPVRLVTSEHFTTELLQLTRPHRLDLATRNTFVVVICTKGCGTLTDNLGSTTPIHRGETVLIPASTTSLTITPDGEPLHLLTSWID